MVPSTQPKKQLDVSTHANVESSPINPRITGRGAATITSSPARHRTTRSKVTRLKINIRVEKASNRSPVSKVLLYEEYYNHHPMDADFRVSKEKMEDPAYMKERARLAEYFGCIALQLQMKGRLRGPEVDLHIVLLNLVCLVKDVTGGRYGLMRDLVTCKEKIDDDGDGMQRWGNECTVEDLLEALEKDLEDNTSLVAVDERPSVGERKDTKNKETGSSGALAQSTIYPSSCDSSGVRTRSRLFQADIDERLLQAVLRLSQKDDLSNISNV